MKEFNFDTLQNLSVPESWIENALLIPEEEDKKPAPIPFWRKPRVIAAAASLVLITVLSVILFLNIGNKPPLAVKSDSKPSPTELIWSTDANGDIIATEYVTVPGSDVSGAPSPTLSQNRSGDPGATTNPSESGRSSAAARPGTTESRSSRPAPTTSAGQTPTDGRSPLPQDPTATLIVDPSEPSEDSTTAPTESGEIIIHGPGGWEPTEIPWYPDATEPPPKPTQPKPTQSKYKASVRISTSVYSISKINQDGGTVYCRIYDDNGNVYGDSDPYSDQHLATLTLTFDGGSLSYSPRDHGILPEDGYYHFEFYTRSGRSLSKGNAYLSAE